MNDELRICLAAFFRNKGKTVVTETEFSMTMSMDLHWMPHADAKALMSSLIANGLLEKNGEYLKPTFDVASVTNVPVGYRPGPEFIAGIRNSVPKRPAAPAKAPEQHASDGDVLHALMSEAMECGMEKREFMAECNNIKKKLNVDIAVAGLMVLKSRDIDIEPFIDRVYGSISKN